VGRSGGGAIKRRLAEIVTRIRRGSLGTEVGSSLVGLAVTRQMETRPAIPRRLAKCKSSGLLFELEWILSRNDIYKSLSKALMGDLALI
jgi:hypothetical protein